MKLKSLIFFVKFVGKEWKLSLWLKENVEIIEILYRV